MSYSKEYYIKNKDKILDRNKQWRKNNPEKYKAQQESLAAARKPLDKARRKKDNLKQKYGLSLEQFNLMLEQQDNLCAICGLPETFLNHQLSVDHDHKTGKVRELLCRSCNIAVAYVENSKRPIQEYIEYVNKHKK